MRSGHRMLLLNAIGCFDRDETQIDYECNRKNFFVDRPAGSYINAAPRRKEIPANAAILDCLTVGVSNKTSISVPFDTISLWNCEVANEYGDQSVDLSRSNLVPQTYLTLTQKKEGEYIYTRGGTIDLSSNSIGIYTKRPQQAINFFVDRDDDIYDSLEDINSKFIFQDKFENGSTATNNMELAKYLKVSGEVIVGSNDPGSSVNVSKQLGIELSGLVMSFNVGAESTTTATLITTHAPTTTTTTTTTQPPTTTTTTTTAAPTTTTTTTTTQPPTTTTTTTTTQPPTTTTTTTTTAAPTTTQAMFNAGRSPYGRSYITIPAKTGLNTQSVHVDGSLQ